MPPETADEVPLEALARVALAAYELAGPVDLRLHARGLNTVFDVTAGSERYALRVHRSGYRTSDQVRSELRFVRSVAEGWADQPLLFVPWPITARNGDLVVAAGDAALTCDLMTWVDGEVLVPGQGLTEDTVHRLGQALASLHNLSAQFRPPSGFALPRWDADGMFLPSASPYQPEFGIEDLLDRRDLHLYNEIADRTRAVFTALDSVGDSYGIVHADYILGNCFLQRAGSEWQVSVFDFDDCGWGYFLYDLCPLLGNLAGYPGAIADNPAYPRLRDAFLAGYRTTRPLPAGLEEHLPTLMAARNANHCLLTARRDVSPTPAQDATWRMSLARQCLDLPH
ncbi:Ser/Thr protein kinase RdoA (MazF antagonist) [Kribbella sp. VKM Ac-2569]|uniref:phosphotransferase enzyme family protein n=1 Tax=Kribbella sp. VKM Ac-2569 TaxID=2512220 RepID=UPI00102C1BC8|nr:phosphotransferase [Kribbella sp. VKM Ac-2569]RZT14715.1 Ser/Thr protein kinase RdoA (MazF antagonist) [Kribbella sp. VKM Ac-2569]